MPGLKIADAVTKELPKGAEALSPGMKHNHYAPKAEAFAVIGNSENAAKYILGKIKKDKKTADDFEKKIFDCLSNYEENSKTFNWDILNGEIETIIQLLKRGRLFIHV